MLTDELLDIVNEQDQVIGQMLRSEIYNQKLSSFRVINAFVINDQNQLLIPRRTKHKKLFPHCLDVSVGGHVKAGETYQQAFERELKEELNLNACECDYAMIAQLTPHEHNVSAFMHVYVIKNSITPDYNKDDFESVEWMSAQMLCKKINNGGRAKSDLLKLIKFMSLYL